MTDEPLTICPKCGGTIRRILFPAGVVFKGPGFYKTDHANASGAGENGHSPKTGGAASGKFDMSGSACASIAATSISPGA